MKKLIFILGIVFSINILTAESTVLKKEKSVDSGITFYNINSQKVKWSYKDLPSNQKLEDVNKKMVLFSYNNGQTWWKTNEVKTESIILTDIKYLFDKLGESSKIINIRNYLGKELNSINENSNFGIYFVTSVKEGVRKTTKVMIVQ